MASTIIQLEHRTGHATPKLQLFAAGSDVMAGEYALTEATNRTGVYTCVVGDALVGSFDVVLTNGGAGIANGVVVELKDDTNIHFVQNTRVKLSK